MVLMYGTLRNSQQQSEKNATAQTRAASPSPNMFDDYSSDI